MLLTLPDRSANLPESDVAILDMIVVRVAAWIVILQNNGLVNTFRQAFISIGYHCSWSSEESR